MGNVIFHKKIVNIKFNKIIINVSITILCIGNVFFFTQVDCILYKTETVDSKTITQILLRTGGNGGSSSDKLWKSIPSREAWPYGEPN